MRNRNILWRIVLLSLLFYSVFSFLSITGCRQKLAGSSCQTPDCGLFLSREPTHSLKQWPGKDWALYYRGKSFFIL